MEDSIYDGIHTLAETKREADRGVSTRTDRTYRFLVWILGGVIVLTATATAEWIHSSARISETERRILENERMIEKYLLDLRNVDEKNDIYNKTNEKRVDELAAQVRLNAEWLRSHTKDIEDMIFMREHGMSNREEYQQKHGYPPPSPRGGDQP